MIAAADEIGHGEYTPTPFDPTGGPTLADLCLAWDADLPEWQYGLFFKVPVFRALVRAGLGRERAGDPVRLAGLWEAAGCPEGLRPASEWGSWRAAVGYACELEPSRLDRATVGRMV